MLKQRVLTALIIVPVVVLLVLYAPTWLLAMVAGLMVMAGTWEWSVLCGVNNLTSKITTVVVVAILLIFLWYYRQQILVLWGVALVALIWWIFALYWVFLWRRKFNSRIKILCGMLTLIPPWLALIALHASLRGTVKVLFLLALIWAADVGAYFAGRVFGKTKLAPEVSPGKTWEGVAGGSVALLLVSLFGVSMVLPYKGSIFIFICLITGWLSIVGDLSESLFKRQAGVKDSGRLFPGHGGVLDRVDSLTAALPMFWLGLALQGWMR